MKTLFISLLLLISVPLWAQEETVTIVNESSVEVSFWLPSDDSVRTDVLFANSAKTLTGLVPHVQPFIVKTKATGFFCRFMFIDTDKKPNTFIFYKVLNNGDKFILTDELLSKYYTFAMATKNGWAVDKKSGELCKKNEFPTVDGEKAEFAKK
jgi:hypothetical protein